MLIRSILASILYWVCAATVTAQAISPSEAEKIFADASAASQVGPKKIPLLDQAVLDIGERYTFIPQPHATKVLNAMGNPGTYPMLQGLVFPADTKEGWFVTVKFENSGYVKDDDAKEWNADDLLKSYREGTAAANQERVKMGVPELDIIGWAQAPVYDVASHSLRWAMSSKHVGEPDSAAKGVNYNTYALGREGYFSVNLVTGLNELPQNKINASNILEGLQYNDGKRYQDFNASTDKIAEYGLAALVVGVAGKKLGLFAMIAVFLAKYAKLLLIAGGGVVALFYKVIGRKK